MPKEEKSSAFEKERRLRFISKLLLRGMTFHEIRDLVNSEKIKDFEFRKAWNLGEAQIRLYIRECLERWNKGQEKNRDLLLAKHLSLREHLYSRNQDSNAKLALEILDSMAKLQGLDKITIEHRVSIDDVLEAIEKIDAGLAREVRKLLGGIISQERD